MRYTFIFFFFAGASASRTPAFGGALAFNVYGPPSWADWGIGSAKKIESMQIRYIALSNMMLLIRNL